MYKFTHLPKSEQQIYFEQVGASKNLYPPIVEKDFWVCWTLMRLFSIHELKENLTFKGGTSLSKAWGLIQRFSEDIDLVINREFFGYGGENSPEKSLSNKKTKERLKGLRLACHNYVVGPLYEQLTADFMHHLPADSNWTLSVGDGGVGEQALLFAYPSCWDNTQSGYIRPIVKIELGARGDPWPSSKVAISSFVAEAYPEKFEVAKILIEVLSAERTFWEKAMLIHEETFRPPAKPRKPRMARHYYDLWSLINAGIANQAILDPRLFESIAAHREVFFRHNWVDYSTLKQGSLNLVPNEDQMDSWRDDYKDMEEMFFGERPSFDELLATIQSLQDEFNTAAKS